MNKLLVVEDEVLIRDIIKEYFATRDYEVIEAVDGEAVALPNKEYLLMELFLNNKNQLFTRSQILNKVWGYDYYGDGRAVDTYIKKLRKKLGVHSHRIQTIMKAGYTYTDEED